MWKARKQNPEKNKNMRKFHVVSDYEPSGDQPQAIEKLAKGFLNGDKYQTTATTKVTETSVDVTDLSRFSFYGRGVNKNALVIASAGQAAAALPCNAVVDGQCSQLVLTDGAYDFAAPTDFIAESVTYDRSIAADKKVTVCLPFDVTAEEMASAGITAYEMDRVSPEGSFHFSPVNEMSANTPYIVVLSYSLREP